MARLTRTEAVARLEAGSSLSRTGRFSGLPAKNLVGRRRRRTAHVGPEIRNLPHHRVSPYPALRPRSFREDSSSSLSHKVATTFAAFVSLFLVFTIYTSLTYSYRILLPVDKFTVAAVFDHVILFILFRYEREFFLNVVTGHGIVSWGAVDTSRSDDRRDEIIGFVTTRMIAAKDSEVSPYRMSWKWYYIVSLVELMILICRLRTCLGITVRAKI